MHVSYFHLIIVLHLVLLCPYGTHLPYLGGVCGAYLFFLIDTLSEDVNLPKNMVKYSPPKKNIIHAVECLV